MERHPNINEKIKRLDVITKSEDCEDQKQGEKESSGIKTVNKLLTTKMQYMSSNYEKLYNEYKLRVSFCAIVKYVITHHNYFQE